METFIINEDFFLSSFSVSSLIKCHNNEEKRFLITAGSEFGFQWGL